MAQERHSAIGGYYEKRRPGGRFHRHAKKQDQRGHDHEAAADSEKAGEETHGRTRCNYGPNARRSSKILSFASFDQHGSPANPHEHTKKNEEKPARGTPGKFSA